MSIQLEFVLFIAAVGVALLIGRLLVPTRWLAAGCILCMLLVLPFDPYAFGGIGGDQNLQASFAWQRLATGIIVILLGFSFWLLRRNEPLKSRVALGLAITAVVVENGLYLARDGWGTRAYAGYEASPIPGIAAVIGLLAGTMAFWLIQRRSGLSAAAPVGPV